MRKSERRGQPSAGASQDGEAVSAARHARRCSRSRDQKAPGALVRFATRPAWCANSSGFSARFESGPTTLPSRSQTYPLRLRARKKGCVFRLSWHRSRGSLRGRVTGARRGSPRVVDFSGLAWSRVLRVGRELPSLRHYIFRNANRGESAEHSASSLDGTIPLPRRAINADRRRRQTRSPTAQNHGPPTLPRRGRRFPALQAASRARAFGCLVPPGIDSQLWLVIPPSPEQSLASLYGTTPSADAARWQRRRA